jgi:succinyl-CoA synthetase alpha subunit
MAILIDQNTRVICQGMTGWAGTHYTESMLKYGTRVVAGVTPGKGGHTHLDRPVFNTVAEAAGETGANASMIFVPPATAASAMIEAIEAEVPLVVALTERVPVLDMLRVRHALMGSRTRLVGPNSQTRRAFFRQGSASSASWRREARGRVPSASYRGRHRSRAR